MGFPGVRKALVTAAVLLFCSTGLLAQFRIPEKPTASGQTSLYDYIGLLSQTQQRQLEQKLIRYSDSTSTQIVIAIIGSTEGENIQYLGAQWGHAWGIGQEDEDNGILVLLARDDRRLAINTGYGVEEFLTDAQSRRIIERVIIPEFKKGDYYAGLDKGTDAIFQTLTGEFQAGEKPAEFPFRALLPLIFFIVIVIILASRNKRGGGRGGRKRGLDLWDVIILSNMGRSGSSGGGFGSGGFGGGGGFSGGFGGGGFGGGGASGGW